MKFISHRKEVDAKVDSAIERMLIEWGIVAQGFATANTPVDTGRLRASITYETDVDTATTVIGTNVEYAPYVELGTGIYAEKGGRQTPWKYKDSKGKWHTTVGMKPHHFMRDAVAKHKDIYQATASKYLNNL